MLSSSTQVKFQFEIAGLDFGDYGRYCGKHIATPRGQAVSDAGFAKATKEAAKAEKANYYFIFIIIIRFISSSQLNYIHFLRMRRKIS